MGDTLTGAKAIALELGITPARVRAFFRAGAPIRALGDGRGTRYVASAAGLRYWLREQSRTTANLRELSRTIAIDS